MDWQKIIEQSMAMLLPLAIIFLFVYYMLKSFFDQFEKQRKQELHLKFSEQTLPLRLQAYERLALFLERISPESMVIRINRPGMSVLDLHRALLQSVRDEYEHNLSQQIYVSAQAWSMVNAARQSMLQLVSECASELKPDEPSTELATDILDEFASISDDPLSVAIDFLRSEARELL
jgi:hypothetical protein